MKQTAVVIPTWNAASAGDWAATLQAWREQNCRIERYCICDSESDDDTAAIAKRFGWEVTTVSRRHFNHGRVRRELLQEHAARGCEQIVFASQDARPAGADSLARLLAGCAQPGVAVAYGRQLTDAGCDDLERRYRAFLYPPQSRCKTRQDIPELRLMAAFCSNAFSVWDTEAALTAGGFPDTDFGEDMLLAARLLLAGRTVAYCADATVVHYHASGCKALFQRGRAIGRMHRDNAWLLREFGAPNRNGWHLLRRMGVSPRALVALLVKYAGYQYGYHLR